MNAEGVTTKMQEIVMWGVICVLLFPNKVAVNVYPYVSALVPHVS